MKKKEAENIVIELRSMGYSAALLESGTRRRSYSVLLSGYGAFYTSEQFAKWKSHVQEYPNGGRQGGQRNER